jgi:hypothetical protein
LYLRWSWGGEAGVEIRDEGKGFYRFAEKVLEMSS